jgi:hypothetical protein
VGKRKSNLSLALSQISQANQQQAINLRQSNLSRNNWDYINELSNNARSQLMTMLSSILETDAFLIGAGAKTTESDLLAKSICQSLSKHLKTWNALQERHAGMTGPAKNAQENAAMLDIGTTYIQLVEEALNENTVSVSHLGEIFNTTYANLSQSQIAASAENYMPMSLGDATTEIPKIG